MNDNKQALAPDDVARRLAVSSRTVYRLLRRGDLKACRVGNQWRVAPETVDELLRGRPEPAGVGGKAA